MTEDIKYPKWFKHHKRQEYYPDLKNSYRYLYELYLKKGINRNTARLAAEAAFIDASKYWINKINKKYQNLKPWLKPDDENMDIFWDTINNGLNLTNKILDLPYITLIILFISAFYTILIYIYIKSFEMVVLLSALNTIIILLLKERNLRNGFIVGFIQLSLIIIIFICVIMSSVYPNDITTSFIVICVILVCLSCAFTFSILHFRKER